MHLSNRKYQVYLHTQMSTKSDTIEINIFKSQHFVDILEKINIYIFVRVF